jgi:hypothetical protein
VEWGSVELVLGGVIVVLLVFVFQVGVLRWRLPMARDDSRIVRTAFHLVAGARELDAEVPFIPEVEDVQELLAGDLTDG